MSPDLRPRIAATEQVIRPHVRRTPVVALSLKKNGLPGRSLTLKLELLQHAGAFKTRGAFSNLLQRPVPPAGVVAASGGNHGVAVAYASGRLGVPAKIFIPRIASRAKIDRIRGYGADLVVGGDSYAEELAAVLVAVGGGGLLSGVASWYGKKVRLVAVEPVDAPTLRCALEAGRPV